MIDQVKRRLDRSHGGDARRRAALDHDDLHSQCASSRELAISGVSAGILGHDNVDAFRLQQSSFAGFAERTACENVSTIGYIERRIDRIDAANKIPVLGRSRETARFLPADGEKNPTRGIAKRLNRLINIAYTCPAITIDLIPGRAAQGEDWNTAAHCRRGRIGGNLVGKGMRRIDQKIDPFFSQVINQSIGAAKAADTRRQGQGLGVDRTAGQRDHRRNIIASGQFLGQLARLGRAAEDQDTVLGHG